MAATLIGLLFVAITLGTGLSTSHGLDSTGAFLTPTLIRFSGVLFESLAMLPPWPSAWPVGIILGLFGLTGLAIKDKVRGSRKKSYSITSSAMARSDGGMVRPSALAAVILMTSSNLVGCSTGISAGFAKILSYAISPFCPDRC